MAASPSSLVELPLLRTKISIPQIPSGSIIRPRLIEQIQRGVEGPLTLIAAPAGFGKTHLLIEWTKETSLPVAWLTVDSNDNDLSRFFRYLIGALQQIHPMLGDEAQDFTRASQGGGLEVGLTILINEISAQANEMALVFDDFQVIENPAVLQGISFLLKYQPPKLHLMIASRSEPEIDLAFVRAKGQVMEVGADELRFTDAEIAQYFQQAAGLQLSLETVEALEERTAGWITSLQMAAISLRNQSDPSMLIAHLQGRPHHLARFLAEEVLDRQPEEIRQFLLRSSILDSLTGPLCEAVVNPDAQPGYGAVLLNRLENAHLFITALDEKHEWFRYHPLFADFLRQVRAETKPEETPELHKRAAVWFELNGNLNEAFRHALASQEVVFAGEMIERNSLAMFNMGEVTALAEWIGRLPDEITRQRPLLLLANAWALIVTNKLDLARAWLDEVRQAVEPLEKPTTGAPIRGETGDPGDKRSADETFIRGGLALCESYLAMAGGDLEKSAELSRQASSLLQDEEQYQSSIYYRSIVALDDSISSILAGDTQKAIESLRAAIRTARQANNQFVMIIAGCALADMQALQGQLSKAWETNQRVQIWAQGPEGKPIPLSGLVDIGLGEILLEHNLLEEARDYLERGCRITQSMWYMGSLHGMISLGRLRQAMGDVEGAQAIVAEAAAMALSTDASEWDESVAPSVAVRLALQRNDLATAGVWWKKGGFPDLNTPFALENYPYHVYEYLLLTQTRFLLVKGREAGAAGDLQQAAELLRTLLLEAERFQRVTSQIEILVLLAMVQSAQGDEGAKKNLLHALALGEPESYRRIFLDEGWQLADLLRQCRSTQQETSSHLPSLAYLDGLLQALPGRVSRGATERQAIESRTSATTVHFEDGLPITLSSRELEVLALIAEGKSNQEISAELYLALNTVKRHAYNIYAKLEVKKRTQAVSRARQLGLIP